MLFILKDLERRVYFAIPVSQESIVEIAFLGELPCLLLVPVSVFFSSFSSNLLVSCLMK